MATLTNNYLKVKARVTLGFTNIQVNMIIIIISRKKKSFQNTAIKTEITDRNQIENKSPSTENGVFFFSLRVHVAPTVKVTVGLVDIQNTEYTETYDS